MVWGKASRYVAEILPCMLAQGIRDACKEDIYFRPKKLADIAWSRPYPATDAPRDRFLQLSLAERQETYEPESRRHHYMAERSDWRSLKS